MPEPEPFEVRLEDAVRGFADRAQTSVDAAAVAARAVRARRHGPLAWLDRSVPVPVPVLLVLVLLLVPVGWTLTGGAPWSRDLGTAPVVTVPPDASTASPTPSAWSAEIAGTESVAGREMAAITGTGRSSGSLVFDTATGDPRTTGAGTWTYTREAAGGVGPAWGPYRMETADGAWEGTCRGSLAADGSGSRSCWLTGTGAHAGSVIYLQAEWPAAGPGTVRGVLVPAGPPAD